MFKMFSSLTFCLFLMGNAFAQIHQSLHKIYTLEDSITSISFEIFEQDEREVVQWAGNTMMTETKIQLFNASKGILNHFIENGRFEIELVVEGTDLKIISKDMERPAIKTTKGVSSEIVSIRFFVPEDFEKANDNLWVKKVKAEEEE